MISNRLTIFSISFVLFALIGIIALPQSTLAEGPIILSDISNNSENNFVPGQIIVGLKNSPSSVESDIKFKGGKILEANDKLNALLVKVPNKAEDAFLEAMKNNPNVTFVVKNHVVTKSAIIPNDPYWGDQWNMKIIKAHEAWSTQLGSTDVTVAVIDTGIDDTHSDLIGRVVQGYDFAYDDNDPMDGDGHGTHVAGTIGATTNNGIGVAGLAQVNILPVKVLDDNGSGSDWSVSQGIIFAESRSDIINLSLGCACTENDLPLTKLALASAYSKNVLIVAAAGNSASSGPHYPSDDSNVISVSATTKDDKLASYSNYGNSIELSAPGGDTKGGPYWKTYVLSTYNENGYAYSIGTSMASPHVAGVAALVLSQYPNLSNTELRTHLQTTADDLGSAGLDTLYGYGRVNALNAVITSPTLVNPLPTANAGTDQTTNDDDGNNFESLTLDGSGSSVLDGTIVSYDWTESGASLGSGATLNYAFSVGSHTVTLTVTDDEGATDTDTVVITVNANQTPIADAGADQTVSDPEADSEVVTLNGSGSNDPDGSIVSYEWTKDGILLGTGVTHDHVFDIGTHTVTLEVTDNGGATSTDTVIITVVDNQAPTANAGADKTTSDADNTGSESVTLDGSGSNDPDGSIVLYEWKEGTTLLGNTAIITQDFAVGIHTVTLTVTDNGGATASDTVVITVNQASLGITVDSIIPNTVSYGDSVIVIITVTNFVEGAQVSLTDGSGPIKVSNVLVVDDNTITATIITKDGGPPRDRVWDVTVTNPDGSSGTLENGFTVTVDLTQKGNSNSK